MALWEIDAAYDPAGRPGQAAVVPVHPKFTGAGTDALHPLTILLRAAGAINDGFSALAPRPAPADPRGFRFPDSVPIPGPSADVARPPVAPPDPFTPPGPMGMDTPLPAPPAAPAPPPPGPPVMTGPSADVDRPVVAPPVNSDLFGRFLRVVMDANPILDAIPPEQKDRALSIFRLAADRAWRDNSVAGAAVSNVEAGKGIATGPMRMIETTDFYGMPTKVGVGGDPLGMGYTPEEYAANAAEAERKDIAYRQRQAEKRDQARALGPMTTADDAVALLSSLFGSLLSPETAVGPGAAAYARASTAGKAALGAGANAATVGITDPIAQAAAVQRGDKKEFSPAEWGLATGGAAALGALIPALGALARRFGALREAPRGEAPSVAPPEAPRGEVPPVRPAEPNAKPDLRYTEEGVPIIRITPEKKAEAVPPAQPDPAAEGLKKLTGEARQRVEERVGAPVEPPRAVEPAPKPATEPAIPEAPRAVEAAPKPADGPFNRGVAAPEAPPKADVPAVVEAPVAPSKSGERVRVTYQDGTVAEATKIGETKTHYQLRLDNGHEFKPLKKLVRVEPVEPPAPRPEPARAPEPSPKPVDKVDAVRESGPVLQQPTRAAEQPPDIPDFLRRPMPEKEKLAPAAPEAPRVEPAAPKPVEGADADAAFLKRVMDTPAIERTQADIDRANQITRARDAKIAADEKATVDAKEARLNEFLAGKTPMAAGLSSKVLKKQRMYQGEGEIAHRYIEREVDAGRTITRGKDGKRRLTDERGAFYEEGTARGITKQEMDYAEHLIAKRETPRAAESGAEAPKTIVGEMAAAAKESATDLSKRIKNVRYGPVENGQDVILFNVDGVPHRGVLAGRNKDLILTENHDFDARVAARALLDGDAKPLPGKTAENAGDWQANAQEYISKVAKIEAEQGRAAHKGKNYRYEPSDYVRDLQNALGRNDEEGFKGLKLDQIARDRPAAWETRKDDRPSREALKGSGRPKPDEPKPDHPLASPPDKPTEFHASLGLTPAMAKAAGPELVTGATTGVVGYWEENGRFGFSPKHALAGALAMAALRHRLPFLSKPLVGKTSYATDALKAGGDALASTKAGRWFHPTMGIEQDLWDKLLKVKVETRNFQDDALKIAKHIRENTTADERILISDWIERRDLAAHGINSWQQANAKVQGMADALSQHVDQIGAALEKVGMLDPAARAALQGEYLHRYYLPKLAADDGFKQKAARMKASGSYALRRGETVESADAGAFRSGDTAVQWTHAHNGTVEYHPPGHTPGADWFSSKEWKVERVNQGKMDLHRDYTPQERTRMGEIRDANFRFAMGSMEASRDLALGTMFKDLASSPRWSSASDPGGWVKVPTTSVGEGSAIKKYGLLAGRWVSPETWDALKIVHKPWSPEELSFGGGIMNGYLKALGMWKVGKTAYNPATHFNNVMGNMSLSMLTGEVGPTHLMKAIGAMRRSDPVIEEARRAGLSLNREANLGDTFDGVRVDVGLASGLDPRTGWTKFMDWYTNNAIVRAYQHEDSVFKLGAYMRRRAAGESPEEAVKNVHRVFFDYSDVPLGVQFTRDFYSPFITYTYKYGQVMMREMAERPHRYIAAFGMLSALDMMSYDWLYGDRAKAVSDYEREMAPKWLQGRSGFGAQKAIRLPVNKRDEQTGENRALMLNTRYLIPGGDVLDWVANGNFGPSIYPQALGNTILGGNPLLNFAFGLATGKDTFFNKPLYPYPDTGLMDFGKRPASEIAANWGAAARFAASQALPPTLLATPDKLGQAAVGEGAIVKGGPVAEFFGWTGTDFAGRQKSIARAIGSSLGVKIEDVAPDEAMKFRQSELAKEVRGSMTNTRNLHGNQSTTETRKENAVGSTMDRVERFRKETSKMRDLQDKAGPR